MAKLTILALLLVALLALAEASYRATVTTATVADENPLEQQQSRCLYQSYGLRYCRSYLAQRSPYVAEKEEDEADNQQYPQTLRQCCQELQNVDEACRCEALRYAVGQQQQEGYGGGGYGAQGMLQRAQNLPGYCNLRPQQCRFYRPAEAS